jgi:hypothetical protein
VNIFEAPSNVGDNYGQRISGFVCVPTTGLYYFYISGNDRSELWLSTTENPADKVKIAEVPGFTAVREWNKYAAQKSVAISLVAGYKYYIEALHKEGVNSDNLAVGWELPGGVLERPIPGARLLPPTSTPATCSATGTILREQFNGVSGDLVSNLTNHSSYPNSPSSSGQISIFEGPTNTADNYGTRIRGFVCAPQTGNYYFYISGNDRCELWLSTSENPANKSLIASVPGFTAVREWNKYSAQKSVAISLVAGQKYYIEALHKEGVNSDNLAVGWELPDLSFERPIPGTRLSPWTGGASRFGFAPDAVENSLVIYPNPAGKSFSISYPDAEGCYNVQIVQSNGALVQELTKCQGDEEIDISELAPGLYFVNIIQGKTVIRKKLNVVK